MALIFNPKHTIFQFNAGGGGIGEGSLFSGQTPGNLGLGGGGVRTSIGGNTGMFSGGMSSTGRNLTC